MKNSELGLFIVKPDALIAHHDNVARKLIGEQKLKINREMRIKLSKDQVSSFYTYNSNSELFPFVVDYVSGGISLIWQVEGRDCCALLGKIKRQLRTDLLYDNFYSGFHASDDQNSAFREIALLGIDKLNNNLNIDRSNLRYRKSTSAVVMDKLGRILIIQKKWFSRLEWDIPGGGIEPEETDDKAIIRELNEELGCVKFGIINKSKVADCYEWPDNLISQKIKKGELVYRGQQRTQFLVQFSGDETDVQMQAEEIRKIKWVFPNELEAYLLFPSQMDKMKKLLKEFGISGK